jgi:hypothetical protein
MIRKYLQIILSIFILCTIIFNSAQTSFASVTLGSIDPNSSGNYKALVLNSSKVINFGKFTDPSVDDYNVTVSDSGLRGFLFGESTGWIVTNCLDTTSGCSATNGNFKVANDGYGNLSGYAWGENAGWINFGPFLNSATQEVVIGSDGKFNGYAWSQNYGWIQFDCGVVNACVETDYRPISNRALCNNTLDDDGDGLIDYPTDGGCLSFTDNDEDGPHPPPPSPPTTTVTPTTTTTSTTSTTGTTGTSTTGTSTSTSTSGTGGGSTTGGTSSSSSSTSSTSTTSTTGTTGTSSSSSTGSTGSSTGGTGTGSGGTGGGLGGLPSIGVTVVEIVGQFVNQILSDQNLEKFSEITEPYQEIAQAVTAVGVAVGVAVTAVSAFATSPFVFADLASLPLRLWSLLLAALGLRKRPWGTVYDSITKQPLDPAYVELKDVYGKQVATSITDLDGRYGFLVKPGIYTINAGKTNYKFPSEKLKGRDSDELYKDLYFGEQININNENEVIARNIPMDPTSFDWNEFAKKDQKLMTYYTDRSKLFAQASTVVFYIGLLISLVATVGNPKEYNLIILSLYGVIFFLRRIGFKPKSFGGIVDKQTGFPIPFSILRVYSSATNTEVAHKVTDATGRYYCIITNGLYYITIEKKNPDGSYTKIYTSEPFEVTKGIINSLFEV